MMKMIKKQHVKKQGSIVILVIFMMAILAAIPFAYRLSGLSRKTTNKTLFTEQSRDVARGGVLDAIHWFSRQTVQPVAQTSDPGNIPYPDAAFAPKTLEELDNKPDDPRGGTIDSDLGLVKEYEFNPEKHIWARHEIRRQSVNNQIDPAATFREATHDVTALRFPAPLANGMGRAWSLVSRGIIYERNSPNTPFNQKPNRILSESFAYSEIKFIRIVLPQGSAGAIVTPNASNLKLKEFTSINGGNNPAIVTFNSTGFDKNNAYITGNPEVQVANTFPMTTQDITGMSPQDLLVMSDIVIETSNGAPNTGVAEGDNGLIYVKGEGKVFAADGMGILFIDGTVNLYGSFRGLVIVNQGATLTLSNFTLNGAILSNGIITSGNNPISNGPANIGIVYNPDLVQEAIESNNHYREVRSGFFLGADQ